MLAFHPPCTCYTIVQSIRTYSAVTRPPVKRPPRRVSVGESEPSYCDGEAGYITGQIIGVNGGAVI